MREERHVSNEAFLHGDVRSGYRHERETAPVHRLEGSGVSAEYAIAIPRPSGNAAEAMGVTFEVASLANASHANEKTRAEKKAKGNFLKFLTRALAVVAGAFALAAAFIAPHIGHIAMVLGSFALFGITLLSVTLGVTLVLSIVVPYLIWRWVRGKRKKKPTVENRMRDIARPMQAETIQLRETAEDDPMVFTVLTLKQFEGKSTGDEVLTFLKSTIGEERLAGKEELQWILDEKNKDHPEARKLNYGNTHFFGATEDGTVPYVHRDDKFYRHYRDLEDVWDTTFRVLIRGEYVVEGSGSHDEPAE